MNITGEENNSTKNSKRTRRLSLIRNDRDTIIPRSMSLNSMSAPDSPKTPRSARRSKSYRRSSSKKLPHSPTKRPSPREKNPS